MEIPESKIAMAAYEERTEMVQQTHSRSSQKINAKAVLDIIENILLRPTGPSKTSESEDRSSSIEKLAPIIHTVSSEMSCGCSSGKDVNETTSELLKKLSDYSGEMKAIITLAAFATSYGAELGLFTQQFAVNKSLARDIALLKKLPDAAEPAPRFNAILELVKAVMELTKCMLQFEDLDAAKYLSNDQSPLITAMADFRKYSQLIILSIVTCASEIASIRYRSISQKTIEVNDAVKQIQKQLDDCRLYIEKEKKREAETKRKDIIVSLPKRTREPAIADITRDIVGFLISLLSLEKDGPQFIVDQWGKKVETEKMSQKTVLILISGLEICMEEITALSKLYEERAQKQPNNPYEIIWVPVLVDESNSSLTTNWDEVKKRKFVNLREEVMPWYTVKDPSLIKPEVIRYMKEEWRFTGKKMTMAALDQMGKLVSTNALEMLWVWGNSAFPFTAEIERSLWQSATLKHPFEVFLDGLDNSLVDWIKQEKFICFYGGEDIEWIKELTTAAKELAARSELSLELVYVGKKNAGDKKATTKRDVTMDAEAWLELLYLDKKINVGETMKKNVEMVAERKISHSLAYPAIRSFWTRLESILFTNKRMDVNYRIMKEVIALLSLDGSDKGWALFCQGSSDRTAKTKGDNLGDVLRKLVAVSSVEEWKREVKETGFLTALDKHFQVSSHAKHCNSFTFAVNSSKAQEMMPCFECGRIMQKFLMYKCCVE